MGALGIANDRGLSPRRKKIAEKYKLPLRRVLLLNLDWFEASTELARRLVVKDILRRCAEVRTRGKQKAKVAA